MTPKQVALHCAQICGEYATTSFVEEQILAFAATLPDDSEVERLRAQLSELQDNGQRLLEAADSWKDEATRLRGVELALRNAESKLAEVEKDAAYYKWRLAEIIPLFEEARDALPAISLTSAKYRGLDLSLGDRMDAAGTRTRADFDAAQEAK